VFSLSQGVIAPATDRRIPATLRALRSSFKVFCNCSGGEGSAKKQLLRPDRRRPDSYMPEEVEDYGGCPRGSLNPEICEVTK
jgi:hypothetical protein